MSLRSKAITTAFLAGAVSGLYMGMNKRRPRYTFKNRVVIITGGSRGLGLVMARQLAMEGARVALLARDQEELARAESQLKELGEEVLTVRCDVSLQEQVKAAVGQVVAKFGGVDVLINNAGIIQVGPLEHMTAADFETSLGIHVYAPLFCSLAVIPFMKQRGGGRIVNISSIGGKIAMPHLLPYTTGKFALVGLSDGLRAELRKDNILVTTVCPGLMRTGSPGNAFFKGQHKKEFAWFAISDSLPLLSVSAEKAAHKVVEACRQGAPRLIIGVHTKGAVLLNELFPGAMTSLSSLANRLLPKPSNEPDKGLHLGSDSQSRLAPSWLTKLSNKAAEQNNQGTFGQAPAA